MPKGQRRYVESLSAYARQFLERMEKPDVDEIHGIAPPIAIRQKNTTRNPRSTVATSTELYDFFRLLWARVGRTYCPNCGTRVLRDTVDQVADEFLKQPEGSRWYALFPVENTGGTRQAARSPVHAAREGLQPALSGWEDVRVFDAGIAAGHRFQQAGVGAGGPLVDRRRHASAPRRYGRDLLSRSGRSHVRAGGRGREAPALQREVRVQDMRHGVSRLRSRACSASTIRPGRARAARDSATRSTTTWIW